MQEIGCIIMMWIMWVRARKLENLQNIQRFMMDKILHHKIFTVF